VAGERRCAAAFQAGLTAVPALFVGGANSAEIALVENLLRQDLNPVEEAEALQRLMDDHGYQQEQLAAVIGKSQPSISKSLSLNRLPQAIRDECRQDPTVPRKVLVEIAGKKQERSMLNQFARYRAQQAKIAAIEAGNAAAPVQRKRTRAESVANRIGEMVNKLGDLTFPEFTAEERAMLVASMTALKETLEAAIGRLARSAAVSARPVKGAAVSVRAVKSAPVAQATKGAAVSSGAAKRTPTAPAAKSADVPRIGKRRKKTT
jgi:ParB family chromosome partitioning protein